jgi:excisionase family DNA binding protein
MEWSEAQMDRPATDAETAETTTASCGRLRPGSQADSKALLCLQDDSRKEMIMTLQAGDKLMSLTDVSEMLGIPVHTLYRWRYRGDGPVGYRVGRHVRYRREAVEAWLEQRVDQR